MESNVAEIIFLGTGGSSGTPMIGCPCAVCSSSDPHDKRLRTSALLNYNQKKWLIDCGPDFRCQALKYGIKSLDGVLLTHAHFDHIAGLDELRVFYLLNRKALPLLLSSFTMGAIKQRYPYLFEKKDEARSLAAQFDFHVIEKSRGDGDFLGLPFSYTEFTQGGMPILGFRFDSLAYISDIKYYPETIFEDLKGVKILVLSMLEKKSTLMHFGLEECLSFARQVGAEKTYLIHIGHRTSHAEISRELPKGVQLAYDGLKLTFNIDG